MAVEIVGIYPKVTSSSPDPVQAHIAIERFRWRNTQTLETGESSRATMFDWIVNKGGRAFVRSGSEMIQVFGVASPTQTTQQYIRTINNGKWTDDLLSLPNF